MNTGQYRYIPFSLSLFLLQILGYNIITLGILALSLIPVLSVNEFLKRVTVVPFFVIFILFSMLIGLALTIEMHSWNIMSWGQFYFFCVVLLSTRDKEMALSSLKYCAYIIYTLDIFTNILLLFGVDLPWIELPPIRPGETMMRYPGIKGSAIYSGCITILSVCFLLQENDIKRRWKYTFLISMIFNLVLSGSYRYFIVLAIVLVCSTFKLYKNTYLLMLMYVGTIVIVYFSTKYTIFLSHSNFLRYNIWQYFIEEISKQPLFGYGFLSIHLDGLESLTVNNLINHGVTESGILLFAYCFGVPTLLIFFSSIIKTLCRFKVYAEYRSELGVFVVFTLDLFWNGSVNNSLTLSAMLLSLYLININYSEYRYNDGTFRN